MSEIITALLWLAMGFVLAGVVFLWTWDGEPDDQERYSDWDGDER